MVLSEVVYWHLPGKTGKSRLLLKNGEQWLATRRKSWWDRSRLTEREFDRALEKLVKAKLIIREYFVYSDQLTPHLRINWPVFEERYNQLMSDIPARATKRRIIMKGINDIWWFLLEILKGGSHQLVTPEGVSPIGYTPSPIGYSVSPVGETVILFGEAYTTYTTNTNPLPQDNTSVPFGTRASQSPTAPTVTESEKPVANAIEEKASPPANGAIPPNPGSGQPLPPAEFDMKVLRDVVANKGFEFNKPKQLLSKSNLKTVKRFDPIIDIITETFPDATDERRAWAATEFYKHWSTKTHNGEKLSIPINADSFGRNWRKWLNEHPQIVTCMNPKPVPITLDDNQPTEPVENPVLFGGQHVNAA